MQEEPDPHLEALVLAALSEVRKRQFCRVDTNPEVGFAGWSQLLEDDSYPSRIQKFKDLLQFDALNFGTDSRIGVAGVNS